MILLDRARRAHRAGGAAARTLPRARKQFGARRLRLARRARADSRLRIAGRSVSCCKAACARELTALPQAEKG